MKDEIRNKLFSIPTIYLDYYLGLLFVPVFSEQYNNLKITILQLTWVEAWTVAM